jgi:hypothetical protein
VIDHLMTELRRQRIRTNDVALHVVDGGPERRRPCGAVARLPELGYSWRHQIPVLADAGYHVIVPD